MRYSTRSTAIGYVMMDNHAIIIMANGKQIGDCPILAAVCFSIRKAILVAIQKNLQRIIIENDTKLVVYSVHDKISIREDITNLVEDIKMLSS